MLPRRQKAPVDIPGSIFEAWKRGHLRPEGTDLVSARKVSPLSRLVIFLVDVSDSMSRSLEWMQKWLEAAMEQAYLRRDPVAVIVVQGSDARVLVHPTTSLGFARHRLARVRVGGGTPLDRGIITLARLIRQHRDAYPVIDVCLITDARSTGPLDTPEVGTGARGVTRLSREVVLLNPGYATDAKMRELAALLDASVIDGSKQ